MHGCYFNGRSHIWLDLRRTHDPPSLSRLGRVCFVEQSGYTLKRGKPVSIRQGKWHGSVLRFTRQPAESVQVGLATLPYTVATANPQTSGIGAT
jgi:hypothetical protein